ncbi:hypothetical protein, partial [Streptococcus pseudopneumoniae]|uniref:hypothetical protein n=1 Tax=Streptococcus pseudopneumoniae TaxID=257758 RepID=UPI0019D5268A
QAQQLQAQAVVAHHQVEYHQAQVVELHLQVVEHADQLVLVMLLSVVKERNLHVHLLTIKNV